VVDLIVRNLGGLCSVLVGMARGLSGRMRCVESLKASNARKDTKMFVRLRQSLYSVLEPLFKGKEDINRDTNI